MQGFQSLFYPMEEVKERIVQKAEELFQYYGLRGVTMDDLARALAISKRTIYQLFKDKQELVQHALQLKMRREQQNILEVAQQASNAVEELVIMFQHFRLIISRLNPMVLYELERYFPEVWQEFLRFKNELIRQQVVYNLERGVAEGYYRPNLWVEVLAVLRVEEVFMAFDPQLFPYDRYHFVEVQEELLRHFIYGIVSAEGAKLIQKYEQEGKLWSSRI